MMILLVGLGNPGAQYAGNRHNVGFMAVERIHREWNGGPWRSKFHGEIAEASVGGTRVMFLKPGTFMNESGRAVLEATRFYKMDLSEVVVIHDEIDLAPGRFRMKTGGGTGGHNGLKSICAHLGDEFRRLRVGVGHPGRKELVPGYVLRDFAKADEDWLDPLLNAFAAEAPLLVAGKDAQFASRVHERLAAGGVATKTRKVQAEPAQKGARLPGLGGNMAPPRGSSPFSALAQLLRK